MSEEKTIIEFQPLDVSYEQEGNNVFIVIWAKNRAGETITLLDWRFKPYFYAILEEESNIEKVKNEVLTLVRRKEPKASVELVEKKLYGKPVKALKIIMMIPEQVREVRDRVKNVPMVKDVLEADIRFSMRYMIDKDIKPFRWYKVPVREVSKKKYRSAKIYEVLEDPIELEAEASFPSLKTMVFDIEVYSTTGSPRPEKDPIIIIGLMDGGLKQFYSENKDDKETIKKFIEEVQKIDPDIISGYNINVFDWNYLLQRAKYNGLNLDVTREIGKSPATSTAGHISVAGRLNVDIFDFAQEISEVKRKTLEDISEYMGVMKKDERVLLEWYDIPKLWDTGKEGREKVLRYNRDDVISTYRLMEKFLPFGIQLSGLTGIPLDQLMATSVGYRLEYYLIRKAYRFNEIVPNREERERESYKGAIVLKPKSGVHENIAVLDFASMYPNIMIKYNVGPDTLVKECKNDECYVAPDVGHKFRKEPPGFFKSVLSDLLAARQKIRQQLKKLKPGDPEYNVLDERQKAIKVLANASYGYMGWQGARWYCKECAEAITAWGRQNITFAIEKAKKLGLDVIYGDTDSLFVQFDEKKINELLNIINSELGLEIKIDKIYKKLFFTEAKKRYVGITIDNIIDIVGFEAIRGDWSEISKDIQIEIARLILEKGTTEKAIEYTKEIIRNLKEKKIPIDKLVIWKTITKPIEEYEVDAPHVTAAKLYQEYGLKISPGDKVGYVVVSGEGKISEKVKPYFAATLDEIDVDYYVDHQIIPAAMRILEYFGVSESVLKQGAIEKQKSLFDYLSSKQKK
ncbi:DNA polymerase II [Fervidicoccus fontis]|uniref:DNA polymerase n=1 Tax=Fervidicoccus fontis TaxID=683846 RepID=A0A843AL79_9CREN|nr:DNA polymerase II [Fervidicoccus fontis]MBE9391671.1 DNA polymerase II [Fervidicoccus fontis]